eukprot:scaffold680953_cov41-Prasinocladus_malaysianus.AAC.1
MPATSSSRTTAAQETPSNICLLPCPILARLAVSQARPSRRLATRRHRPQECLSPMETLKA